MLEIIDGDLSRTIFNLQEVAAKDRKMLKGREIAWHVERYFEIVAIDGPPFEIRDLMAVALKGDNLPAFIAA